MRIGYKDLKKKKPQNYYPFYSFNFSNDKVLKQYIINFQRH